jgi:hypothetical protein
MRSKVFEKVFVGHCGLARPLLERGEVFLVFPQRHADSIINEIGHGPVGMDRLDTQGAVKLWVQVDRGTLRRLTHGYHLHERA